jgi:hypothetical protein
VDPDTGQVLAAGNGAGTGNGDVSGIPVSLASDYAGGSGRNALMALAVLLLVGVSVGPPLAARYISGKGRP